MDNQYIVAITPQDMPDDKVQELLKHIFNQHPFKMVALKRAEVPQPVLGWAEFTKGEPF